MYASMQRSSLCGVAAARLHRWLQHPPPFVLRFSLVAVLPLACLTSRPAALRDAPRYFTFKIIRKFATIAKTLCAIKIYFRFNAVAISLNNREIIRNLLRNFVPFQNFVCTPRCIIPRASLWEPRVPRPRTGGHVDVAQCRHICLGHQLAKLIGNYFRVQCFELI